MPLSRIALLWLVGVLVLVLILTSALVLWDENRFLEQELENRARTLANLLVTAAVEDGNPSRIPLAGLPELRWARIRTPSGHVLWQFGRPPEHSGGEPVVQVETSSGAGANRYRIELTVSTTTVRLHVLHSGLRLVLGLAMALAVALLAGAVLFERVSAPLDALARRMTTFDPESPPEPGTFPSGGARELTELAASFSAMADRLAEQRRQLLEGERLREAQKMEAVATLAGGIAHDFNNLLTGVLLHVRLLEQGEGDGETVAAIRRLAEEGVHVVNELLLFARRETAP
ncbi:MAG TPA: hybrid sensor histidine kinase/response regulator, partial [Acidobacteria bacterium]|nr:hybrid sensor histidine kinase/response regulator [Acidobacteriota bacterium]